jgi:hypothetical protein
VVDVEGDRYHGLLESVMCDEADQLCTIKPAGLSVSEEYSTQCMFRPRPMSYRSFFSQLDASPGLFHWNRINPPACFTHYFCPLVAVAISQQATYENESVY